MSPLKEKKKILIVSRSFYPVNSPRSFRTTELVKEFARQGHDVTLLTLRNGDVHDEFEKKYGAKIKDLGALKLPEIDTRNGPGVIRKVKYLTKRALNLFFEYPDVELVGKVNQALKNESGYDLLISIAVPHPIHWGVARVVRNGNKVAETWVADCGDPYMGFNMDVINKPFYFKYAEKAFCKRADYISVPIEGAKDAYYEEFREKIVVIPQGFNFEEDKPASSGEISNEVPAFAYAGDLLGGGRDPRPFLNFIVNSEREFKFIIYTRQYHIVKPYLEKARGRIELREYIPRKELLKILSGMDFLVNFENDTSKQMPSKLIDYYLAGRPVLSLRGSEIDHETVDRFLTGDYFGRYKFTHVDQYRIENVCERFLDLCK